MIILWLLKLGITMLIHNKDDIEFVTEFSCFLGHPVCKSQRYDKPGGYGKNNRCR